VKNKELKKKINRRLNNSVVSFTSPVTTAMQLVSKYFGISSAINFSQFLLTSLGFKTAQFPAMIAPRKGENWFDENEFSTILYIQIGNISLFTDNINSLLSVPIVRRES
jgi:hypothetical protein